MKGILQKNTKPNLVLALLFSFFTLSLSAQDFSPEVSFSIENPVMGQVSTFSFEISQSEGETDILNSTITTNGGSFDIASLSAGDVVGSGSGFIGGGSSSGEFSLVVNAVSENSADLDVVNANSEVIGMMNISNSLNNGVSIYAANTYDDGNNVTAGNLQQVELMGIFTNPMSSSVLISSSIFSELDPNGPSADYSTEYDLLGDFSPAVSVSLSSQEPLTFTNLSFSVSQDAGEEDMATVAYVFNGGSFALSSISVGDVVGSGTGSFGGGFATGNYSIVVDQVTATTAVFNAVDDSENVIATFSVVNYADDGAEISSTSPGDNNTTTAGNSNDFTLEDIFITPDSDMLVMTADLVSEMQSSQTNTFEVELEEVVDFSPVVEVAFANNDCNEATDMTFTISQDADEIDMASSILTMTGGSFDFSSSEVGDLVGTGTGFYAGNIDFNLSLFINEITATGAIISAVNDDDETQTSSFTLTNLAEGVQITTTSPGDDNTTTAGNSTTVTLSNVFTNPDEGDYEFYGSFTSELNNTSDFEGGYAAVCPCDAITSIQEFELCAGQTLSVGDNTYSEPGEYVDVLVAVSGCDSTVTTTLSYSDAITSSQEIELCAGETLTVGDNTYSEPGEYVDVLVAVSGCDSTVTTTLSYSAITSTQEFELCAGETLTVGDNTYSEPGEYVDVLVAVSGCDSTVTTTLSYSAITSTQEFELCAGETLTVGDNTYSEPGEYVDVLVAVSGCDSTVTTTLSYSAITSTQEFELCAGETLTVGDNTYSESGEYVDVLVAVSGCDSTVTTTLSYSDAITSSQEIELCAGETLTVGDNTYSEPGEYVDVLVAVSGCDSTVTTTLSYSDAITSSQEFELCAGETLTVGDNTYSEPGEYVDVLVAVSGCDSTVTTTLSYSDAITSSQEIELCAGETLTVGDNTYSESGEYVDVLVAVSGCDSVVTTFLLVYSDIVTPLIDGEDNVIESENHDYSVSNQSEYIYEWGVFNGAINTGQGTSEVNITWGDGPSIGTVWLLLSGVDSGCKADTAFLEVTISEAVGITENPLSEVNIYPNPFKESTTVEFNNPNNDSYRISLMDARGRIVMNTFTQSNQLVINKNNLQEGIYFLEIDGKNKSRQIVVVQ